MSRPRENPHAVPSASGRIEVMATPRASDNVTVPVSGKKRKRSRRFSADEDMRIVAVVRQGTHERIRDINWTEVLRNSGLTDRSAAQIRDRFDRLRRNFASGRSLRDSSIETYFSSLIDQESAPSRKRLKTSTGRSIAVQVGVFTSDRLIQTEPQVFGDLSNVPPTPTLIRRNSPMTPIPGPSTPLRSCPPVPPLPVLDERSQIELLGRQLEDTRGWFAASLRKRYQVKRILVRKRFHELEETIGRIRTKPHAGFGAEPGGVFFEGAGYLSLLERQNRLKLLRKGLIAERKALRKLPGGIPVPDNLRIRYRLVELKSQMKVLLGEKARLDRMKAELLIERKRILNEDGSNYRHFPMFRNRYLLVKLVGKGGFAEVWKGVDLHTRKALAFKIHFLDPSWDGSRVDAYIRHVNRECEILRQLPKSLFVDFIDKFLHDPKTVVFIMEYVKGPTLSSLLKVSALQESYAKSVVYQIMKALLVLYRRKIIHYDLKPGNILLTTTGEVRVADFGLSKLVRTNLGVPGGTISQTSFGAGTYYYLPPECFARGARISSKVDIWSLGIIFYQCLFGRVPFGAREGQRQLFKNVVHHNQVFQLDFGDKTKVSETAKHFIAECLTSDVVKRPTIEQLYLRYDNYFTHPQ